jgi:hypothetical protein
MTAKTILIQLHHKVATFEHLSKHLVLAVQDSLLRYVQREFAMDHVVGPAMSDSLQIHAYRLKPEQGVLAIRLDSRRSTDAAGVARALGLQAQSQVDLATMLARLGKRLSPRTLWQPA